MDELYLSLCALGHWLQVLFTLGFGGSIILNYEMYSAQIFMIYLTFPFSCRIDFM